MTNPNDQDVARLFERRANLRGDGLLLEILFTLLNFQRTAMSTLADLSSLVSKISTDIDTKLAADAATIAQQAQQIADLQAQLAAFQGDQAAIDQAVADLTAADAKLA